MTNGYHGFKAWRSAKYAHAHSMRGACTQIDTHTSWKATAAALWYYCNTKHAAMNMEVDTKPSLHFASPGVFRSRLQLHRLSIAPKLELPRSMRVCLCVLQKNVFLNFRDALSLRYCSCPNSHEEPCKVQLTQLPMTGCKHSPDYLPLKTLVDLQGRITHSK